MEVLRRFRDEKLMESAYGRKVIDLYYEYSPQISELLEENPELRNRTQKELKKLIPIIRDSRDKAQHH
jgi:hypothetical protein